MESDTLILEILTGILVLITAFYAWATYRMLKANEKVIEVMQSQYEAMTRPYITVSPILEADNPIFYLRIKNTGKTPAQKLKLTIDKSFYKFGKVSDENNLSNFTAFKEVIKSFHPNAEIDFSLVQAHILFDNDFENVMPTEFSVIAEYAFDGKTVKENNIIDLKPYKNANVPQDAYVRKLKDIASAIDKISSNGNKS